MNETSKWVLKTLREKTPCECCLNSLKALEQNGFPETDKLPCDGEKLKGVIAKKEKDGLLK